MSDVVIPFSLISVSVDVKVFAMPVSQVILPVTLVL